MYVQGSEGKTRRGFCLKQGILKKKRNHLKLAVKPRDKESCDATGNKLDTPYKRRRASEKHTKKASMRRGHGVACEGIHDRSALYVGSYYDSVLA